jgi:hypothetical protein
MNFTEMVAAEIEGRRTGAALLEVPEVARERPFLSLLGTRVPVAGLARPLRVLHLTDAYPSRARGPDGRRCTYGAGPNFDDVLDEVHEASPDFVALTGNLVASATAERWNDLFSWLSRIEVPYGITLGENDWIAPGAMTREQSASLRKKVWLRFIERLGRSPEFEVFAIGGLHLAFIDDSDFQVSQEQLRQLNYLSAKREPIAVFCNVPLALLAPDRETSVTRRFRKHHVDSDTIVGVFAGRLGGGRPERSAGGVWHYSTPGLCDAGARLITFVPKPGVSD